MVNPYIAAMVAGFNIIVPIKHYFFERSISKKQLFLFPIISFLSGILFWMIFGMITFESKAGATLISGDNFRQYAFNLNSFFNAYGSFSQILPDFGMVTDKQYEGYGYFGLGMLFIVLISSIYFLIFLRKDSKTKNQKNIFYLLTGWCFILFLFSLSNQITFGKNILLTYPIPDFIEKIGFIFRASGRFCWPFYYFIFLFSIIVFSKIRVTEVLKGLIFFLITVLQLYDINNLITYRDLKFGRYKTALSDQNWIKIFSKFDKIVIYPCFNTSLNYHLDYQDLCYLALKANKPITNGYVARDKNPEKTEKYKERLTDRINSGEIDNDLFITTSEYIQDFNVLLKRNNIVIHKLYIFIFDKAKDIDKYFNEIEEEKAYFQSVKADSNKGSAFIELTDNFIENNIKFYLENYNSLTNQVQLKGWAFVDKSDNNKGDSIFISLENRGKNFFMPSKMAKRLDITQSYKKTYLDDSGFKAIIFTDNLESGIYQLGILIKTKEGKYHYTKTDKKVVVNKKVKIVENNDLNLSKWKSKKIALDLKEFFPIKKDKELLFYENSTRRSPL